MIVLFEILDLYNDFDLEMQIHSFACAVIDEEGKVIYRKDVYGKAEVGTDTSLRYWANANNPSDETPESMKEHLANAIQEINSLIQSGAPICQWGDWQYLLKNLNSRNFFNLKFRHAGKYNLEQALTAIDPNVEIDRNVTSRLDNIIKYFEPLMKGWE